MSKSFREDLTGKRFGRLTVIEFVPIPENLNHSFWRCKCDCGVEKIVRGASLKDGRIVSCGCFAREQNSVKNANNKYGEKHGLKNTRIYRIWSGMKARCFNPNLKAYKNYGGRGITVCNEWRNDVKAFYDWAMENGYAEDLTIDRIDVNGDYKPSNCRWINAKNQSRNKRNNIFVTYDGRKLCISEASEMSGISRDALLDRYHKGDRGERLFRPSRKKKKSINTTLLMR